MDLGLGGRKALVTGGTRGIGRAICEALADEGCDVALCARNASQVRDTVAALEARGVRAVGEAVDVADADMLAAFIARVGETFGRIDVLVANVSALATGSGVGAWEDGMRIDVLGTVRTVDAALPYLRRSDAGSIIILSSTAALEIYAGLRPYNSIKAALIAYVKGLSQDLAPGIRANSVSPGAIYFPGGVWNRMEHERPELFRTMLDRTSLGRLGRPDEIARAVVFLASPAASFITGANLVVDGGMTKRVQY